MVQLFNYCLMKMQEAGIMSKLKIEMGIIPKRNIFDQEIREHALGYEQLLLPFSILLIGLLVSIAQVVIEGMSSRIKNGLKKINVISL